MARKIINDKADGKWEVQTESRHTFVLQLLRIELVDDEGKAIPGEPYEVRQRDTVVARGRLDTEGKAAVRVAGKSEYRVDFPNLAASEWQPAEWG